MKHREERAGSPSTSGSSAFARVEPSEKGYSTSQVDTFFTRLADDYELMLTGSELGKKVNTSRSIRETVFKPESGGYLPGEVDRALDRVEDRFSELERRLYIQRYGQLAWNDAVEELRQLLCGRLSRPQGERFRRPSKHLAKGYFVKEVDAFCNRFIDHLQGRCQLLPGDVRSVSFTAATGQLSYEETQVDAFLDRCIEYLQDTL